MDKIKVLEVIGGMNMGGAETFLMNVLRNINYEKIEMYFLCYGNNKFDYEEEINKLGGHIIRIDNLNKHNFFKYISINKKIIKENNINVVHSHTYYNSMFATLAAHKCNVKTIITHSHNTFSEPNPSLIKKIYFMIAKWIINNYSTVFLACGKDAGRALFYKKNKFNIIDNGIILEKFYYNSTIRDKKRKELGIKKDATILGHVGRFDEVKNHKFILEIFNEYKKINSNSKLILIGDGILKSDIIKQSKNMGIYKDIIFLGKRNDVNEIYNAMDVLLFPSLFEGLPVTLIEAQTNGLPILASDTIDKDVNISKKIKFYSLSKNNKKWAEQLDKIIDSRYNINEVMENSLYNMKKNVYKLERIYEMEK